MWVEDEGGWLDGFDGWMMDRRVPCLCWYLATVCPVCALLALYCVCIGCVAAVQVLYVLEYRRSCLFCTTVSSLMLLIAIFRRTQVPVLRTRLRVTGLTGNPLILSPVVRRSLSISLSSNKLLAVFSGFGPGLKLFFPGIHAHPSN